MAKAELLAVGLPNEHVLHMLVVPGAEEGPSFLQAVELVPFQRFDHGGRVGRAGPAHRFQDLHHGRVAEVAARRGRVVVLVDHALNEAARAFRVDLWVPDQTPDTGVVRVPQRPPDLLAPDHAAYADLLLGQLQLGVGFQRVDQVPAVEIQDDGAWLRPFGLGEGRGKVGRPEWRRHY